MQLKYIELQGFKSFPDKTTIKFGNGITAIVGPNGSGKSNIADAVRWVMGETSSKQLRGQKMEDVIFDGTKLRKPLGFAEVSLVLDNSDHTLPIEFDEVAISRRYYRSGESEYYINRATVRLRDIQDLLRDTGLGKTGYSIIGQGAITEIISAKSTDRRFLFEEAAGIAKFKFKKEESERKLLRTEENIVRLSDIIAELFARLEPLEEQAKKARKYIELREEKKGLEITLWIEALASIEQHLTKTKENLSAFNEDTQRVVTALAENERETVKTVAEKERLTAEIEDFRAAQSTLEEAIQKRKTEILVRQNDIEHAKKDIERIKQSIADTQADSKKSDELVLQCEKNIEALTEKIQTLAANEGALLRQTEQAVQNEKLLKEQAEKCDKETELLRDRLTYLQVRAGSLLQEIESREKIIQGRRDEIEDAKERLLSLTASRDAALKNIAELTQKTEENKNIRSGYTVKLNAKTAALQALDEKLSKLRFNRSDKQNRLQILQGMEKHYDGFQNSVRSVMDEAKKGVLSGVEGTVSDLIDVDKNYTTAVETALGGALQNIITSDEKSGKNCIWFLKNRNAGRATFLPLDTIKPNRLDVKRLEGSNGFVGLCADLVECAAKYKNVVDFMLGRTVVAQDMDSATRIARENRYSFRIVTLDGQLVNVGGSMTGGSTSRNFGILSRKTEIGELETECKALAAQEQKLAGEHKQIYEEISAISATVEGVMAEQRVYEEQLIKENSDVQHFQTYADNISQQERLINNELASLAKNSEKSLAEQELIAAQTAENEQKLALQDEQSENVKQQLAALTEQINMFSAQLNAIGLEKLEAQKDLQSEQQRRQELLASKGQKDAILAAFGEEIKITQNLISGFEGEIASHNAANEQTAEKTLKASQNIRAANEACNGCEQRLTKLRADERELYITKEKLSREVEKATIYLENANAEHDGILTRIWDEYELTLDEARQLCIEIGDKDEAQKKVNRIKASMKALGNVNLAAIDEYVEVKERYETLNAQVEDLQKAKKTLEKIIVDLVGQMEEVFKEQFKVINTEFNNAFRQLFNGGEAKLSLENPDDVLNSGVEILVAPPGKIIKNLASLSGGEQSLTAIALYFAILTIRPAPFCLLDEIEAALDDVNVARYAEYLARHEKTQFIVITHRRGTMEAANMLYGVTMKEKGISKILAIDVSEIEKHI